MHARVELHSRAFTTPPWPTNTGLLIVGFYRRSRENLQVRVIFLYRKDTIRETSVEATRK